METATPTATAPLARIRALAGIVCNQIAAGEVIERPASVVKELMENSFDAGARRIQVEIEAGGVALVQVRDDGCGIHRDDLELALSRHATSKIASLDDLERVRSFGFRGEALPSIASVSRLKLASRTADSDSGFELRAEGVVSGSPGPAALPPGTCVSVRDLFFNTPARRKFLRTERTEYRHIEEVFKRAALSRFDVGLSLHHNGKEVFRLAPAPDSKARASRVARLLGRAFAERAVEVEVETSGMALTGWLGTADAARGHPDTQYLFINGRVVRDSTVRHAVRQAFGERLPPGRHPAYLLYLDLDPSQVDVNVHPAKHEVRFRQSRLVHDFLWRGLARALDNAASLSLSSGADGGGSAQAQVAAPSAGEGGVAEWNTVYRSSFDAGTEQAANTAPPAMLAGRYAVCAENGGVTLVDLAQCRRLMLLRELNRKLESGNAVSRPLLLPLTVTLEEALADGLEPGLEVLAVAGFDLRRSAPGSMTLRAVPACLAHVPASALLQILLRWSGLQADPELSKLNHALARAGGDHLDDLAQDAQALAALIRFARAHSGDGQHRLELHLNAAAVADLMKR